jgi:hypothetical protein
MQDSDPNPPLVIGKPVKRTSLGELMAWAAMHDALPALLYDIGWYYYNPAPRDRGRER